MQRIIGMASRDQSIFKSFLSFHFDALKNLTVKEGKLHASIANCLVFKAGAQNNDVEGLIANYY